MKFLSVTWPLGRSFSFPVIVLAEVMMEDQSPGFPRASLMEAARSAYLPPAFLRFPLRCSYMICVLGRTSRGPAAGLVVLLLCVVSCAH